MSLDELGAGNATVLALMLGAYIVIPALLARFLIGARWLQVVIAFPVFWLALFLVLGFGRIDEEVFGWTFIMAMFSSWLGVPLAALFVRWANLPYRLL